MNSGPSRSNLCHNRVNLNVCDLYDLYSNILMNSKREGDSGTNEVTVHLSDETVVQPISESTKFSRHDFAANILSTEDQPGPSGIDNSSVHENISKNTEQKSCTG